MARTYLYLENWDEARNYAEQAHKIAGITTLTNDANAYKALYNSEISNSESMFALAITNTTNWSANSYGTLWSTYNFSPSPKLISMYATNDCRKFLLMEEIKLLQNLNLFTQVVKLLTFRQVTLLVELIIL